MAHKVRVVFLFLLFLTSSLVVFMDGRAYAKHSQCHCCMCGACSGGCWCPGKTPCCRYCQSEESAAIESQTFIKIDAVELRRTAYQLPLDIRSSDASDRIPLFVHGSRSGGYFVIDLVNYSLDHSKFGCHNKEF